MKKLVLPEGHYDLLLAGKPVQYWKIMGRIGQMFEVVKEGAEPVEKKVYARLTSTFPTTIHIHTPNFQEFSGMWIVTDPDGNCLFYTLADTEAQAMHKYTMTPPNPNWWLAEKQGHKCVPVSVTVRFTTQ